VGSWRSEVNGTSNLALSSQDERRCLGAVSRGVPTLFLVKDLLQIRRAERLNEELAGFLESITQ
jgi:hypothetical protein